MNREDIIALFARRRDAWTHRDADALAATHAADAIAESPMQGRIEGRTRIRDVYAEWFTAFPDLVFTTRHLLVDAHHVAEFFSVQGTQSAPFHGVAATKRRIDINGALLYTIGESGLIVHDQRVYDVTRMLVQLGMLKAKPADARSSARDSERAH